MERKCPYCNEPVPSNSINCPSCFKPLDRNIEIVVEPDYEYVEQKPKHHRSKSIAFFLALIPGAFGLMGLGLMYLQDYKRGAIFLLFSLPMMIIIASLIMGIGGLSTGWTIVSVGFLLLMGLAYIVLFIFHLLITSAESMMHS